MLHSFQRTQNLSHHIYCEWIVQYTTIKIFDEPDGGIYYRYAEDNK